MDVVKVYNRYDQPQTYEDKVRAYEFRLLQGYRLNQLIKEIKLTLDEVYQHTVNLENQAKRAKMGRNKNVYKKARPQKNEIRRQLIE